MPENYFADAEAPAAAPETEAAGTEVPQPETTADDSATAELPKALLGGKDFNVGDRVELEVVKIMEDSVLVKYYTGDEEQTEAPPPPEPAAAPGAPPGGMAGMME